jgi:hypothetical protein
VVAADAVAAALGGRGGVPDAQTQHLTPGGAFDFYSIRANHATGEVLVTFYGDASVYRYAVPAPGALGLLGVGGVMEVRRRRRGA